MPARTVFGDLNVQGGVQYDSESALTGGSAQFGQQVAIQNDTLGRLAVASQTTGQVQVATTPTTAQLLMQVQGGAGAIQATSTTGTGLALTTQTGDVTVQMQNDTSGGVQTQTTALSGDIQNIFQTIASGSIATLVQAAQLAQVAYQTPITANFSQQGGDAGGSTISQTQLTAGQGVGQFLITTQGTSAIQATSTTGTGLALTTQTGDVTVQMQNDTSGGVQTQTTALSGDIQNIFQTIASGSIATLVQAAQLAQVAYQTPITANFSQQGGDAGGSTLSQTQLTAGQGVGQFLITTQGVSNATLQGTISNVSVTGQSSSIQATSGQTTSQLALVSQGGASRILTAAAGGAAQFAITAQQSTGVQQTIQTQSATSVQHQVAMGSGGTYQTTVQAGQTLAVSYQTTASSSIRVNSSTSSITAAVQQGIAQLQVIGTPGGANAIIQGRYSNLAVLSGSNTIYVSSNNVNPQGTALFLISQPTLGESNVGLSGVRSNVNILGQQSTITATSGLATTQITMAAQASSITATSGQTTAQLALQAQTGPATIASTSTTQSVLQVSGTQTAVAQVTSASGTSQATLSGTTAQLALTGQGGATTIASQSTTQSVLQISGQQVGNVVVQGTRSNVSVIASGNTIYLTSNAPGATLQGPSLILTGAQVSDANLIIQSTRSNLYISGTTSGSVFIGSQGTAQVTSISGGVIVAQQVTPASDMRLKEDVRQLYHLALANIASLQGFLYKESELVKKLHFTQSQPIMAGLSAQEVQKFAPEIVKSDGFAIPDLEGNVTSFLALDYSRLAPYFVEAIKELKERVEILEAKVIGS